MNTNYIGQDLIYAKYSIYLCLFETEKDKLFRLALLIWARQFQTVRALNQKSDLGSCSDFLNNLFFDLGQLLYLSEPLLPNL